MDVREAKIREIKNLNLIYFYSVDSIFKGNTNKYIGAKVVYNDKEVIHIDYKDKNFGIFVKRILERYNKEKDRKKIILLGEFTRKLINESSFSILETSKRDDSIREEIPFFEVENKNLKRYESYLKEVLKMIISLNIKFDDFEITKIRGYNNHYVVTYKIRNIEYNFPIILYNNEDELNFRINRISDVNTDIKGTIKMSSGKVDVSYYDGDIKANLFYNALEDNVTKEVKNNLDVIYYDETRDVVLTEDMNKLKFYFDLLEFDMPSNIIKVNDDTFLLSEEVSNMDEEDILYKTTTYLISMKKDNTIITKNVVNGFSKYDNRVNVVLDYETEEYMLKNVSVNNKNSILQEKRLTDKSGTTYSYDIYEVEDNYTLDDKFKIEKKYKVKKMDTLSDIKSGILHERGRK
ncbi:MAG: hypothetical protein IJ094_01390 [Bacilli bacterium]|nr:hypothetical protein [Bacilli bacterium]